MKQTWQEKRLLLSSNINAHSVAPFPETVIATLYGLSVTVAHFIDGEETQVIELTGEEMDVLIRAYRSHVRAFHEELKTTTGHLPVTPSSL